MGQIVKATDSFAFGTAFHSLLLEPLRFSERYEILPELNLRTKAGKEAMEALLAGNEGKFFLSAEDMGKLQAMADSVMSHPTASEYLIADGLTEVSIYTSIDDIPVKVRADKIIPLPDSLIVIDIKTTRDASPASFRESVEKYGYHVQRVWYTDGIEKVTGKKVKSFIFVVVEKSWPYITMTYQLGEELLEKGREIIQSAWGVYKECLQTGEWPGYSKEEIVVL